MGYHVPTGLLVAPQLPFSSLAPFQPPTSTLDMGKSNCWVALKRKRIESEWQSWAKIHPQNHQIALQVGPESMTLATTVHQIAWKGGQVKRGVKQPKKMQKHKQIAWREGCQREGFYGEAAAKSGNPPPATEVGSICGKWPTLQGLKMPLTKPKDGH